MHEICHNADTGEAFLYFQNVDCVGFLVAVRVCVNCLQNLESVPSDIHQICESCQLNYGDFLLFSHQVNVPYSGRNVGERA